MPISDKLETKKLKVYEWIFRVSSCSVNRDSKVRILLTSISFFYRFFFDPGHFEFHQKKTYVQMLIGTAKKLKIAKRWAP